MSDIRLYTPIEPIRNAAPITHSHRITMLGSCFTDNIGECLKRDGFDVSVNPLGVLFNPASIATVVNRALNSELFTENDLVDYDNRRHCLFLNTRYTDADATALLDKANTALTELGTRLRNSDIWIITFGTAWTYTYKKGGYIVGNCHKIPAHEFERGRLSEAEIYECWSELCADRRIIFTVSPVRHVADGLHGNNLSKAILHLSVERLNNTFGNTEYFPAYEILCDQLRDYRFYDRDLKHPSNVAIDIIYDFFAQTYFSKDTRQIALKKRAESLFNAHRLIIEQ